MNRNDIVAAGAREIKKEVQRELEGRLDIDDEEVFRIIDEKIRLKNRQITLLLSEKLRIRKDVYSRRRIIRIRRPSRLPMICINR